jgi:hypothetical protein
MATKPKTPTLKPATAAKKVPKPVEAVKKSPKTLAAVKSPVPSLEEVVKATQKAVAPKAAKRAGGKSARSAKLQAAPQAPEPAPTPGVERALERNLAKQPPRALNSPIRVFQMYSESWQRELLDSAFYALDVSRVDQHTLDLSVWTQLQGNPATQGAQLWGAVSWRFVERTGMTGADWVRQIESQPGADVYFSSVDGQNEGVFHNPWLQAETQYVRFMEMARAFFEANGLPLEQLSAISPSPLAATGGMLVGSTAFWAAYIPWLRKLLVTADKRMTPALRDLIHAPIPEMDPVGQLSYLPVIIDRLLPVFLRTEGQAFKATRIALPERDRELNVHQKLLREMKDVAHRTQSAWLAACWVNYRNLYLGQTQNKPWIQKYLRSITPTEIKFG